MDLMKRYYVYAALFAFALTSCVKEDLEQGTPAPAPGTEVKLPADAEAGELLIKFKPEMSDILDRTFTRATRNGGSGVMTRSGIPSTDEILDIIISSVSSRATSGTRRGPAKRGSICGTR